VQIKSTFVFFSFLLRKVCDAQASLQSQVENMQKQLDEVIAKQENVNSKLKYVLKKVHASLQS